MNHNWYVNRIIIDSREKNRGHNAYNHYMRNYDTYIEQLNYGDYLFETNDSKIIVFEYKTCEDFISSMENRTLFYELSNQSIHHEYSYLIVEGDFEETFKNLYFKVPHYRYKYKTITLLKNRLRSQVNGAFDRIYSMYIPIVFVENEKEAFEKMLKITSKVSDAKKYGGIVRPVPKKVFKENPTALFLTTLDGIGEKKAKNITNELDINCLDDLCEKKPSDFLSVKRITNRNVREIWKRVHNEDLDI